jgi:hypothetical protein
MKKLVLSWAYVIVLVGFLSACGVSSDDPLGVESLPSGDSAPADAEPADPPAPAAAASTCDVAREAFLTGTPEQIEAAMRALIADRTADATAREYAQKYLEEDNADLKDMNKSLIQMSCS